jgi:hypothetical protein
MQVCYFLRFVTFCSNSTRVDYDVVEIHEHFAQRVKASLQA